MNTVLRWIIAVVGWLVLLIVYGVWKDIEKHTGGGFIAEFLRGLIVFGGAYYLYKWAKDENRQTKQEKSENGSVPVVGSVAPAHVPAANESAVPVATNFTKAASPENLSAGPLQTAVDEDRVYAEIAKELETGVTDKGLWTRLFAECGGDEKQTKVLYIKQRAERLRLEQAQAVRERTAETMRLEELRLQCLEQEKKLLADVVTPLPATTNIASVPQLQSESQQNDEFAGWIVMAIVVSLALLTAVLMQMK